MHTFLAAFFTALFSFCHASSVHQASTVPVYEQDSAAYRFQYAPTRRELARAQMQPRGDYAGSECLSCRKMNAVYYTR